MQWLRSLMGTSYEYQTLLETNDSCSVTLGPSSKSSTP